MKQIIIFAFCLLTSLVSFSQEEETLNDSIKRRNFIKQIGQGFLPSKLFKFDLRYLIKYNQYEGFRTGIGGVTDDNFSEKFKINSYAVYGFVDKAVKYSIGGSVRLEKETNTWLNYSYTDDLIETGSTKFILDKRFFQFFEPRLLNIDLFHKHITNRVTLEHEITPKIASEVQFAVSNISPTYGYNYNLKGRKYNYFEVSTAKLALQWMPFSFFDEKTKTLKSGFPKFTLQYTRSFKNVFNADFTFAKTDFRVIHKLKFTKPEAYSLLTLIGGYAHGETPLTHLYHSYPNNINKETILQRFSVAGINSFETMYFNEFFSDRFLTFIVKHYFEPFHIARRFNPQLVLINRFAIGNISHVERHEVIEFNTLDKGYSEIGFELNKLLFGFGLSTTYRYGAYHLPREEDNIAIKFTFNITL